MPKMQRLTKRSLPQLLRDMETEPVREDWLRLTPGRRLLIAWRQRRRIKNLEAAHDAQSLPRL